MPSLVNLVARPAVTTGLVSGQFQPESLTQQRMNRDLRREAVRQQNVGAGLRNRALAQELEQEPLLQEIRKKAAAGDQMAMIELASIRPGQARQIQEMVSAMGEPDRQKKLQEAQQIASQAISTLSTTQDPRQRAAAIQALAGAGYMKEAIDFAQKGDGGFTLSPGQQRFGPGGELIASAAPKPGKITMGNVRLKDGRIVAATFDEQGNARLGDQVLEPGTYSRISQQVTGAPGEFSGTKSQVGKDVRVVDFADRSIATMDKVLGAITEDPTLVGIPGAIRQIGQTITGTAKDIGSLFENEIQESVNIARPLLDQTELSEEEKATFFDDPNLSKIQLWENSIGLALARTQTPEGGRVPVDVIRRSVADAKLTGLTTAGRVVDRIKEIREQMRNLRNDAAQRANIPATGQAQPVQERATSEMTLEEMREEVRRLEAEKAQGFKAGGRGL